MIRHWESHKTMSVNKPTIHVRIGSEPHEPGSREPDRGQFAEQRLSSTPPIDIHEGPDGLILEADLPGATDRNLHVQLEDNVLSLYARIDSPASREQKAVLAKLSPEQVTASSLAGEPITAKLTRAPGNGAGIGGLKVTSESGWFAARPSGTEDVYKLYAESFKGTDHLAEIQAEAQAIVAAALGG